MLIYLCKCIAALDFNTSFKLEPTMKRTAWLLLASLTAACSTPAPPAAPPPPPPPAEAPAPPPAPPPPPPPPAPVVKTESPIEVFGRMRAAIENESVYFDFDKYAIKPDQTSVITDHAKLANDYSNDYLTLQGNCDERGSREYNLALGQRRADAVKQKLVLLGVPDARMETISFGKEKPRALCHEEKCWSQNRRVDFVDTWK
jgi:peptidoglycan-associated lipoprotein